MLFNTVRLGEVQSLNKCHHKLDLSSSICNMCNTQITLLINTGSNVYKECSYMCERVCECVYILIFCDKIEIINSVRNLTHSIFYIYLHYNKNTCNYNFTQKGLHGKNVMPVKFNKNVVLFIQDIFFCYTHINKY